MSTEQVAGKKGQVQKLMRRNSQRAGEDKPVEDMPGRRTRGGKSFDQAATNKVNTATIAHPAEDLNQLHHELSLNSVEQQMREREYLRDEYVKQSLSLEVPNIFGFTSMFQKQGGSNEEESSNVGATTSKNRESTFQEGLSEENKNEEAERLEETQYLVYSAAGHQAKQAMWNNDKDIPWAKALANPELCEKVKQALQCEYDSLTVTHKVLRRLLPGDAEYEIAVRDACKARAILGIKRCGRTKVRIVLRGDLQDTDLVDPANFNYYARVVSLTSVRAALGAFNASEECMAFIDISTAFLQTDRYDESVVKYVKLKDPLGSGETFYFRQLGSLYGERSAPALWERTISTWIVEQGFVQGKNDPCCFYHPLRIFRLTLYVDDLKLISTKANILWLHNLLVKRFETRELVWIEPGVTEDYLGMEISMDCHRNVFVSMQEYSLKLVKYMETEMTQSVSFTTPAPFADNNNEIDETLLDRNQTAQFQKALGCIGWLVSCIRLDLAYTYSRIAQDMSQPNKSSWVRLIHAIKYIKGTSTLAGFIPCKAKGEKPIWTCFCDSDQSSDRSARNQGKCRYGSIVTVHGFPVHYKTQTTSVAMAQPSMGTDGNVCTSSTEAEIYGCSNAATHAMHVSYIAEELGYDFPKPFVMLMDNAAAEVFCNNTASYTRLKHIDLRQQWVALIRNSGIMVPKHIDTKLNLADMFTKGLTGITLQEMTGKVLTKMLPLLNNDDEGL